VTDKELRFPVQFDQEWWTADLARATPNGRKVAEAARLEHERDGVPRSDLRPCEAEGRDGTELKRCFKVYLPRPAGRFGMIFRPDLVDRKAVLRYLAFGVRHHPPESHAETVYQIAHRRLHG
jgi:hypothetical protein